MRIYDGVWCRRGHGKRLDLTQVKGEAYVQAATIRAALGRLFRGAIWWVSVADGLMRMAS